MQAGLVFGHGVSSLVGGAVDVASSSSLGLLCHRGIAVTGGEWALLPPGTFLWDWGLL